MATGNAYAPENQREEVIHGGSQVDHNHPLFIHPSDTPGAVLVSQSLERLEEDYPLWSWSMRMALLARNKIGFIDGTCPKNAFDVSLGALWEHCNARVLSWLMNTVSSELLGGTIYSSDAYTVWNDLEKRFDKVKGSRIFQLHKEIGTTVQGTGTVMAYFTRLRMLWGESAFLVPVPSCNCEQTRRYVEHLEQQKLLQFLMGLNESFGQARSQILMMIPLPTLNQAYSMIEQEELQRAYLTRNNAGTDIGSMAFMVKNPVNRGRKEQGVICDYCHMKGHKHEQCYRLIGYPSDFKFKNKREVGDSFMESCRF